MKYLGTGLALIGLVLTGCVSEELRSANSYGYHVVSEDYQFEPLPDARLELSFMGPKTLKAGKKGEISFALKNAGKEIVRIDEWRQNEPDNLKLYCQVWLPGQTEPDPDRWLELDAPVKKPERRHRLELFPGNRGLIKRELAFLEDLIVSPGAERRYYIRAELNLQSVKAESPVAAFSVIPADL